VDRLHTRTHHPRHGNSRMEQDTAASPWVEKRCPFTIPSCWRPLGLRRHLWPACRLPPEIATSSAPSPPATGIIWTIGPNKRRMRRRGSSTRLLA